MSNYFIGIMSGTSLDGIDGVLLDFSAPHLVPSFTLRHAATEPLPPELRAELLALNSPGDNELHRASLAGNALARAYAKVVDQLLHNSGLASSAVRAIGAHGQTVRHRPGAFDGIGYTLQLNNPALLAELTGIDVVADFRSRDVAAGGQGAPLVPAFHQSAFDRPDQTVCVLNLGGMANLSVLAPGQAATGFDCGPGNALMDAWCQQKRGQPFDAGGAWAASGNILPALLQALRDEDFFTQAPPKSTGRDLFNPAWLQAKLANFSTERAEDVQATLTELTASTCADSVQHYGKSSQLLILCGGGAFNRHLRQRLQHALPGVNVESSEQHGLAPLHVEASAFAWLAERHMQRQTGNLASVTGARGKRILGALYPAQ